MFSFKKSLIALVGVLTIVGVLATLMPLVGQGQGQAPFAQRRFYLTKTTHNGSQALTACADGYHMASLWEILDPSNLRYDTELGFTTDDSGFGPPTSIPGLGFIRTGNEASGAANPGVGNCNAWTSTSPSDWGTAVSLSSSWNSTTDLQTVNPWRAFVTPCVANPTNVWCVQD